MTEGSIDATEGRRYDRVAGGKVDSLAVRREVQLDDHSASPGWSDVDVQCKETL